MRTHIALIASAAMFVGCTTERDSPSGLAKDFPSVVYLHVLQPKHYGAEPSAARCLGTAKVRLEVDTNFLLDAPNASATAHLARRGDEIYGAITARYGTTTSYFTGAITLDEPEIPQSGLFSGVITSVIFVVSRNQDPGVFVQRLDGPFDAELYNRSLRKGRSRTDVLIP